MASLVSTRAHQKDFRTETRQWILSNNGCCEGWLRENCWCTKVSFLYNREFEEDEKGREVLNLEEDDFEEVLKRDSGKHWLLLRWHCSETCCSLLPSPLACVLLILYYAGPLFCILEFNDLLCFPEGSINIPIKIGMKYYMFGMLLLNGQRWKRSQENRKIGPINFKYLYLWSEGKGKPCKLGHTEILKYLRLIRLLKLRTHLISISILLEMQIHTRLIKQKTTGMACQKVYVDKLEMI